MDGSLGVVLQIGHGILAQKIGKILGKKTKYLENVRQDVLTKHGGVHIRILEKKRIRRMIKGSNDGNISQDPHVMEVASSLVNDVIEKAREEVLKRKSVSQNTENGKPPSSAKIRRHWPTTFMPKLLNILLQKSDANHSWGFEVSGGGDRQLPLTISKVHPNSFCAPYVSENDEILEIEGIDAKLLSEAEALTFVRKPGKRLNLIVRKNDTKFSTQIDTSSSESSSSRHTYPSRIDYNRFYDTSSLTSEDTDIEGYLMNTGSYSREKADILRYAEWTSSDSTTLSGSVPYAGDRQRNQSRNSRQFWRHLEKQNELESSSSTFSSDLEYDSELFKYDQHDRSLTSDSEELDVMRKDNATLKPSFDEPGGVARLGDREGRTQDAKPRKPFTVRSVRSERDEKNISRVYLSPFNAKININDSSKSFNHSSNDENEIGRQSNQPVETGSQQTSPPETASYSAPAHNGTASPPAPPAPPPPPPPVLNGNVIPTIRLKSEIPARSEPPAKIQSAMMKDKKPFTYTPGGIDLSEIKSPRMQRRIVRNAQEPEDIVLPPTSTPLNANALPPSAVAAMMPQIAIPVFPQNGFEKKTSNQKQNGNPPPPPPPPKTHSLGSSPVLRNSPSPTPASAKQTPISSPPPQTVKTVSSNRGPEQNSAFVNEIKSKTAAQIQEPPRTQVGSLYIPPVANDDSAKAKQSSPPVFPTLREAPTPWLQKHQTQPENVPVWVNRNNQNHEAKVEEPKPHSVQINIKNSEMDRMSNGSHIIPIQIEGAGQKSQQNNRPNPSQRWGNNRENNETVQPNNTRATKQNTEPDSKPIQSRSFRVLQKITGSEDDSTDLNANIPYNSEGVPLSQLRKLRLNDDDKEFMNKVKAQGYDVDVPSTDTIDSTNNLDWVDDDTFLHMETDPRYRGSVIPSRAFRMLQNMTDSSQVTSNNVVVIPVSGATQSHPVPNSTEIYTRTNEKPVAAVKEIETKKNYIPPSERQAEQELRKYMGSSIPSRSFRMLQAMTASQDPTGRDDGTDF